MKMSNGETQVRRRKAVEIGLELFREYFQIVSLVQALTEV